MGEEGTGGLSSKELERPSAQSLRLAINVRSPSKLSWP